ncbi:helix-turn-helix domain-containing protein [Mycolicibacterium celeriflavum]|nr:helix-turn-helix domain-containing protein [Mycolicibacterium celeriflavum]
MSHSNAPLSETGRLRLARCVVDDGWSYRRAAERFQVAVTTVQRWVRRYRGQKPVVCAWPVAWSTTAGRIDAPLSDSRSR